MYQRHVNTDVQTYGCLAMACNQKTDGLQLLKDMEVRTHFSPQMNASKALSHLRE